MAGQRQAATSEHSAIPWLGDARADQVALVGAKAAQLSRLSARYRVPPGFCLTTRALEGWTGERCPDSLNAGLARALAALCRHLDGPAEPWLAVRSSGVDEDGREASFAGQFETVLGVRGLDALVAAVVRCRESARLERVQAYCQTRGRGAPAGLAVLVQALVPADVSFVAFSANPLTGDRAEVMVNASWGLGESIVGGTTTPDSYLIRGQGHEPEVVECRIGAKTRMTVLGAGGTREVPVPRLLQERPALSEAQALEVAALARQLDHEHGWPVDLEGAFHGRTLYLLQCRPITTSSTAGQGHDA